MLHTLVQVLAIAVLAIFLTAPLGGIAISLLGPLLLSKEAEVVVDETLDEKVAPDQGKYFLISLK